jgi:hypothetical protein
MVITLLLLFIATQDQPPASDVVSIFEHAAASYSSVLEYHALVETKVTGGPDQTRTRYTIASSRPRSLFTDEIVLAPIRYQVRLGTDGAAVWGFSPSSKRYVEDTVAVESAGLLHDLKQQHYRFFDRFQELAAFVGAAVIEGRDVLRIPGEPHRVPCVRIRLALPDANWTEQLWIEESRYLVRKSILSRKEVMETVTTTTLWQTIDTTSQGAVQFRFTPPANAKLTNQLMVP